MAAAPSGQGDLQCVGGPKAVRVRQHVNPLKKELQIQAGPLPWATVFDNPARPLVVDVGCGYGRFLLKLANDSAAEQNYLGLEIRGPIIERANLWAQELELSGCVHFAKVNATISFASMLESYPGPIVLVCVQFPDPHFKKRHQKRHTVQPQLCRDVAAVLEPGARVFLQSDVLTVSEYMRDTFERTAADAFAPDTSLHTPGTTFQLASADVQAPEPELVGVAVGASGEAGSTGGVSSGGGEGPEWVSKWAEAGWLTDNPVGVPTEREVHVYEKGGRSHRIMLVRRDR